MSFRPDLESIPMKLRQVLCVTIATLSLSALPVTANDKDPFDKIESMINPETLLRGVIREDDVSLLFQRIRESIAASVRGEEAQESEAFKKRSETISRELSTRGGVLLGALLTAFEATAKQIIREEFGAAAPRSTPHPTPRRESSYPSPNPSPSN